MNKEINPSEKDSTLDKENITNEPKDKKEIALEKENLKKEGLALTEKVNLIFREKIKSYFIISLIILIGVNILLGFFIWMHAQHTAQHENIASYNRLVANFNDALRAEIKNEILKEHEREYFIPADYVSLSQYVYKNGRESVVEIESKGEVDIDKKQTTGIILDNQGYVLTNAHAVTRKQTEIHGEEGSFVGYTDIKCKLNNGHWYKLMLLTFDVSLDLAILKIENPPEQLSPITFGNSDYVSVGEDIAVLGNPWGSGIGVISGVVANTLPYVVPQIEPEKTVDMVQLNITLLQGNSGAPVFNMYAEMVGLISFKMSQEVDKPGIGFAVSVKEIVDYIKYVNNNKDYDIQYTPSKVIQP